MKKILTSIILITFNVILAQIPEISWTKKIGGSGFDRVIKIYNLNNGGYFLIGNTTSYDGDVTGNHGNPDEPTWDIWLVKIDVEGNLVWQDTIGEDDNDIVYDSQVTSDGGYILVGSKGMESWIGKLNNAGDLIWETSVEPYTLINTINQTSDGGYIIAGEDRSSFPLINHSISKLNYQGDIEWSSEPETPNGTENIKLQSILQTSDGGYIIGKIISDSYYHTGHIEIIKLNSAGDHEWQKFGNCNGDWAKLNFVKKTNDNGIIYSTNCEYVLVKLDENGNTIWGGYNSGMDLLELVDGGFVLVNHGPQNRLVKVNNIGQTEWFIPDDGLQPFENTNISIINANNDEGYLAAGSVGSGQGEDYHTDFYIIKYDKILSVNEVDGQSVKIYPNPVKEILNFSEKLRNIEIYTIDGKKVLQTTNKEKINVVELSSGLYIIKAEDINGNKVQLKFVKQ